MPIVAPRLDAIPPTTGCDHAVQLAGALPGPTACPAASSTASRRPALTAAWRGRPHLARAAFQRATDGTSAGRLTPLPGVLYTTDTASRRGDRMSVLIKGGRIVTASDDYVGTSTPRTAP
jgi:hypothetical protein